MFKFRYFFCSLPYHYMQLKDLFRLQIKEKTMSELKTKFDELENRIQKLIYLHKQVKSENTKLVQLNRKLELELKDEKEKYFRLEEGLTNLKESERNMTNRNISGIKRKINEMIGEIDRSVTLISEQHKK